MLLTVDVGNTNVTIGAFEDDRLVQTWRLGSDLNRSADEYGAQLLTLIERGGTGKFRAAVIGSVVRGLDATLHEACERYLGVAPFRAHGGLKTGLRVLYDPPRDVGIDRIADAVAAVRMYGKPVVVVDLGTATVFDAVSRDAEYLGGAIAPGIGIGAEALFSRASRLYRVELTRPAAAIGGNTVAALQSGIVLGHISLIEGMVARFRAELGDDTRVVATGGFGARMAEAIPAIDHVNPDLTLQGLRLLWEMNVS